MWICRSIAGKSFIKIIAIAVLALCALRSLKNIWELHRRLKNVLMERLHTVTHENRIDRSQHFEDNLSKEMETYLNVSVLKEMKERRAGYNFSITPWKIKADKPRSVQLPSNVTRTNISVVVFVKSLPEHILQRKIARWTWAGFEFLEGMRIETVFILGIAKGELQDRVREESDLHGDILQTETEESYRNVIHKTIAGMQFAAENFLPDWFYTSADDDIMPDLMLFKEKLLTLITQSNRTVSTKGRSTCAFKGALPILCGFRYNIKSLPRRNESSKWFVSSGTYPNKYYPPYCNGGWYTMTVQLAKELYQLSKRTNYFWIDDVWITGLLRVKHFSSLARDCFLDDIKVGLWTSNPRYFAFSKTGNDNDLMTQWGHLAAKIYETKSRVHV